MEERISLLKWIFILREAIAKYYKDGKDIEVDGGICVDTIDEALNAGANVIVAGTSIFHGDIEANAKALIEHF